MANELTVEEQQYLRKYLSSSGGRRSALLPGWVYLAALVLGAVVAILSILLTLNELTAGTIRAVLVPGLVGSVCLLAFGATGLLLFRRKRERIMLGGVLRKILGPSGVR